MTAYVLLFLSVATGQPLTGDGDTLVFHSREVCQQAGRQFVDIAMAQAAFRFVCIRAEESPK